LIIGASITAKLNIHAHTDQWPLLRSGRRGLDSLMI